MNTHSNAKQIEKKISMTRAFEALPAEIGPEVKMLVARELKKKKKNPTRAFCQNMQTALK